MTHNPTPAERQELALLQQTLKQHATNGTTPPQGSFTRVLREASPNVRAHILQNREFATFIENGGRSMPFAPRIEQTGPVPKDVQAVRDALKTEELSAKLMDRMGTTESQQREHFQPPSLRDIVSASVDVHQNTQGEQYGN